MVNKVILVGNLGRDPELKTVNDTAVCNFSLATTEKHKDKEHTEWHNIVMWGKLAELCNKYLVKGRQCYIEGKIQTRSWDDRDGNKRQKTEIVGYTVQFLGGGDEKTKSNVSDDLPDEW